jgi:geranylgeranyl reductase family protein
MTARVFDVAISGCGPAGAAAAYTAAKAGADVICFDKAQFPRDKPCGDGLTPSAVQLVQDMGCADALEHFHLVDHLRIVGQETPSWEIPWPKRAGLPGHGYVIPRRDLDQLLLQHAEAAGATIHQGMRVVAPVQDHTSVCGLAVRDQSGKQQEVRARIVIAADGAYSPVARALRMTATGHGPQAVALRAEMPSARADDRFLEIYPELRQGKTLLPGYGWVFPLGGGQLNVGVGYLTTYRKWKEINANDLMNTFLHTLPPEWELSSIDQLSAAGAIQGWRLPLAFRAWPPWRPGCMLVGDAVGAAKPYSGAGISKALQTGLTAGQTALAALAPGGPGPDDLSAYETALKKMWGTKYRVGRGFDRMLGRPSLMRGFVAAASNARLRQLILRGVYGPELETAHR